MVMSAKAVFISDIHLRSSDEPNARLLVQVFDTIENRGYTHLFLLGDIFDLWIADHRYFVERFAPVLSALERLRKKGIEIHYFEGNHDLDLKPYFEKKLGAVVHESAFHMQLGGRKLRLEHGDQMDPSDRDYLFLRWLLRTPIVRWLGRHLPQAVVGWIGETASKTSRHYTMGVRNALGHDMVEQKQLAHAEKVFAEQPYDLLIAGHVHVQLDIQLPNRKARLINLGTWLERPCVFELSIDTARLKDVSRFISFEATHQEI